MKYDTKEIRPTVRYILALKELMRAELEMMKMNEPEHADCWDWGICKVDDISTNKGLSFEYGGIEDKPKVIPVGEDVMVIWNED